MRSARRAVFYLLVAAGITACGGGGGGGAAPATGGGNNLSCSVAPQIEVFDIMRNWYFFNDEPEQQQKYDGLDPNSFPSAEALLSFLRYRPAEFDRGFSFTTTVAEDSQFFGEGVFIGFGFGSKFVDSPTNNDLRISQVIAGSPADVAGMLRGQRILTIDGRSIAEINLAEGVSNALGANDEGVLRTFLLRDSSGSESTINITKTQVTLNPLPFSTVFDVAGAKVGYLDFRTFISTANQALDQAFAQFESQAVSSLVVDLRYNGGGLVSTANRLADLIGGAIANNQILSETLFNSAHSDANDIDLFQQRASSLTLLQQVVFITTGSSASASELVINALLPHIVVTIVGGTTFGKPVGQAGFSYCDDELLLRPVTFETVNSLGEGRYFNGIAATCSATDDLGFELGNSAETSLATALNFIETGSCGLLSFQSKPVLPATPYEDLPSGAGSAPAQRLAGLR
jgi:carboxyl-terminal processing protease